MIELLYRGGDLVAQLSDDGNGIPWFIILFFVALAAVVVVIIAAARKSVRRCTSCKNVCTPASSMDHSKSDPILKALSDYEGIDVPAKNVMICVECSTAYNCSPRTRSTVATLRLNKQEAATSGTRLQVDHFACHKCGWLLTEGDSPMVHEENQKRLKKAIRHYECPRRISQALFCEDCETIHLWCPLADTGYRFLRAVDVPGEEKQEEEGA